MRPPVALGGQQARQIRLWPGQHYRPGDRGWLVPVCDASQEFVRAGNLAKFVDVVADGESGAVGGVVGPQQRVERIRSKRDDAEPGRDLLREELTREQAAVICPGAIDGFRSDWFALVDLGQSVR